MNERRKAQLVGLLCKKYQLTPDALAMHVAILRSRTTPKYAAQAIRVEEAELQVLADVLDPRGEMLARAKHEGGPSIVDEQLSGAAGTPA